MSDSGSQCGRWNNGRLGRYCAGAGTEYCLLDCPFSRQSKPSGVDLLATAIEQHYANRKALDHE